MGGTSGKFRKALQTGDEKAAEDIYFHSSDFQKALDPNTSYGENYNLNTPLHFASRYGMLKLLRIFIEKHNGNPNKRNSADQTSLHCLCMYETLHPTSAQAVHSQYYSQPPERKRLECLRLLLNWQGIPLGNGEREKVDVNAADSDGNTALHYAAESGYSTLVELLLDNGASLFAENIDKETPCDRAEKQKLFELAQYLESKMVFCDLDDESSVEDANAFSYEETYLGMRIQDLQGEKDQLLVETADMLRVPLFTAEALLRQYDWSRELLLEAWISNPRECCESSGVKPPENIEGLRTEHRLSSLEQHTLRRGFRENMSCAICLTDISLDHPLINIPCSHLFCQHCWERYLTGKIQEGNTTGILCPAFECFKLVPIEVIESLVSSDMTSRYQHFDIKAFVDSNPNLKWCPKVECGRAVKIPDLPGDGSSHRGSTSSPSSPPPMSRAVDCGSGHFFCWDCCGEPHAPCSCENWSKWNDKIKEIQPESLTKTEEDTESAANCLWLVTNSKPCPKCNSPIQKNEGCNHMKCTKCKYDFCWVCLEPWSKHSSATGGYFRCNRYEVVQKVEEKADELLSEAEKKMKEMEELNRFLHYYTRYRNHGNSFALEEPLKKNVHHKMKRLGNQAKKQGEETKFILLAIDELLRARVVLRFSYPYGYFLEDKGGSKQIFEFMQNELEESTETLSQMVARQFLRTPRPKVIHTMHLTTRKRNEFLSAVSKGFLPPDSPQVSKPAPSYQQSEEYPPWTDGSDDDDEDLRKAIEASIQDAMCQYSPNDDSQSPDSSPSLQNQKSGQTDSDQSTMTVGLMQALEMSRLLLMQQADSLSPSGTASEETSPSQHSTVEPPQQRKQKIPRLPKRSRLLRHRSDRTITDDGPSSSFSSFDFDLQRAMALSLQDIQQTQEDPLTASTSNSPASYSQDTEDSEQLAEFRKILSTPHSASLDTVSSKFTKERPTSSKSSVKGSQVEHGPSRKGKSALKGHGHQSKSGGQSSGKGKSSPSLRSSRGQMLVKSNDPMSLKVSSSASKLSTSPMRTSPSKVSSVTKSAPSSSKTSPQVSREASSFSGQTRQLSLKIGSGEAKSEVAGKTNVKTDTAAVWGPGGDEKVVMKKNVQRPKSASSSFVQTVCKNEAAIDKGVQSKGTFTQEDRKEAIRGGEQERKSLLSHPSGCDSKNQGTLPSTTKHEDRCIKSDSEIGEKDSEGPNSKRMVESIPSLDLSPGNKTLEKGNEESTACGEGTKTENIEKETKCDTTTVWHERAASELNISKDSQGHIAGPSASLTSLSNDGLDGGDIVRDMFLGEGTQL
ncbi:Ankyrin repeat and IBR domain-containing protein 1 [Holothuria leucospilota]|uniref:RBR-type E3 ubiquitin transferase n=1 Tax=Holothuria leucospilota TaxID=206669 RepID=A0A9Q0YBF9_HOLLE|nr:Ankyrin repeat and IBR domain-containing protein 1 [Holothuria leucospilota]